MAYATNTDRAYGGQTLAQRVTNARAGFAARFARYQTYRRTLNELADLNDRELADLGIARADIGGIAREAAYGA